jgi:hypothetical protein
MPPAAVTEHALVALSSGSNVAKVSLGWWAKEFARGHMKARNILVCAGVAQRQESAGDIGLPLVLLAHLIVAHPLSCQSYRWHRMYRHVLGLDRLHAIVHGGAERLEFALDTLSSAPVCS